MHLLVVLLALGPVPADPAALPLPAVPRPERHATPSPPGHPPGSPPPAGGLGLAEVQQIAARNNPTLAQAVARWEQARGRAQQAGAYPNPLFIWGAGDLGDMGTVGTQRGFIQQPITTGGKLRLQRAREEVEVELSRVSFAMQQIRVRNGVHLRYLQILSLQHLIDLHDALVRGADGVVAATRAKVESGHADEADLLMAENEAEELRLNLDQAAERYRNVWREFAAFLGCPELPPTRLVGTLEGEVQELEWEPTLARLLAESPEMQVARLRIRRETLGLKRQEVETIPDLVLRAGAGHDPTDGQTNGYTQLYVDLPLWDRNRGNIHTARHGLAESQIDLKRIRLSLEQRLTRDFNHHQTSVLNVRRYREQILPRYRRAFEMYLKSFREEDGSFSRVQTSQAAYAQAYVKYVLELLELRRAEVAIAGLLLYDETIESGTPRPAGEGGLERPGQGVMNQPAGGGVPVGTR